jgi:hypothetical protein
MKLRSLGATAAGLLLMASAIAQQNAQPSGSAKIKRTAEGHPDLSGLWTFTVDLPPSGIKRESNGKVTIKQVPASSRQVAKVEVKGALPYTDVPAYKPEFQA